MTDQANNSTPADFGAQLRAGTAAVRVQHEKLGVRRTLTAGQLAEAAATFGAESSAISAAKKLLDTKAPAYRAVTAVRNDATAYWRSVSIAYPEAGVRLIRRERVESFAERMAEYRAELSVKVAELQAVYAELREQARRDLGDLFNPEDYPASVVGAFSLAWDFPSVEPPEFLKNLHPELYAAEQARIGRQFAEAVELAEQAFAAELAKLVEHLAERLGGDVDGKPKVFRDTAVENLKSFFDRFSDLSVGSSTELETVVLNARELLDGADPKTLRQSNRARDRVTAGLRDIGAQLDSLMVDRAARAISLTDDDGPEAAAADDGPAGWGSVETAPEAVREAV